MFDHPSFTGAISKKKNGETDEFFCIETQKELICDEVKKLLITVCSQEEHFTAKFEIAPIGRASQLSFLIKINNEHIFEKSLSELIQFCAEMNMWSEGKNANIEQLYLMVQEVF